ncbi:MAG: hypothetical protein AAB686_03630 [Patescibacteria group bacterium]
MLIFLYGPDDWRREQKKNGIIAEFKGKHSALGIGRFDLGEEGGIDKLWEFIDSQSIFESAKLVILDNLYEITDKHLADRLKTATNRQNLTILISEAEEPPKLLESLLAKKKGVGHALNQEFEYLHGAEWKKFLATASGKLGFTFEPEALEFLSAAYMNDTWRAMTEMQKLAALGKKVVNQKDLERFDVELTPDFWSTLRGLKGPRIGERLTTLEGLFARSEPAAKIFNILSAQWPERIQKFAAYDLVVKSGKAEYEEVLLDLLLT